MIRCVWQRLWCHRCNGTEVTEHIWCQDILVNTHNKVGHKRLQGGLSSICNKTLTCLQQSNSFEHRWVSHLLDTRILSWSRLRSSSVITWESAKGQTCSTICWTSRRVPGLKSIWEVRHKVQQATGGSNQPSTSKVHCHCKEQLNAVAITS